MAKFAKLLVFYVALFSLAQSKLNDNSTERFSTERFSTERFLLQNNGSDERQQAQCGIQATDPLVHGRIKKAITEEGTKLIEYKLVFINYSGSPALVNVSRKHKYDKWTRVSTNHGQTLLSLAFNYGVLSLMTLTFQTDSMTIELADFPRGCLGLLDERQSTKLIQQLLMRDLKSEGNVTLVGEERICQEIVVNRSSYAHFTDRCCFVDSLSLQERCEISDGNEWLKLLHVLLTVIRFGILVFGPLLFVSYVDILINEEVPYEVRLKEPLKKSMVICCEKDTDKFKCARRINFERYDLCKLPKLCKSLRELKTVFPSVVNQSFQAYIYEYYIRVQYKRLLVENEVPIGFWKMILSTVFLCKLSKIGPFVTCCNNNMFRHCFSLNIPWIKFWRKVGLGLLVLLLPTPYYIRLLIFYFFEYDEVMSRKETVERLGLKGNFENSLVQYLLPTHPIFIGIYVVYVLLVITLAIDGNEKKGGYLKTMIVGGLSDLKELSCFSVINLLVSNVIWPFENFGLIGIVIVPLYWPIVIPMTFMTSIVYCLPTTFLTFRMGLHSTARFRKQAEEDGKEEADDGLRFFMMKTLWQRLCGKDKSKDKSNSKDLESKKCRRSTIRSKIISMAPDGVDMDELEHENPKINESERQRSVISTKSERIATGGDNGFKEILKCIYFYVIAIVGMYSLLIILSECIGCCIEILVFTMMGVIVNAGALLKYVTLILLVVIYIYDSFNNVEKKYFKLNKFLFGKVKEHSKGVEEVTNQPSSIQPNVGFKSQELSEQGEHEQSDDVAPTISRCWFINDLILFIDSEDVPRIPKKLFEKVCTIRVEGVPGPVYLGLMTALKQFFKMAVFVIIIFLVILSFGEVYGISSTNQTLAALMGGLVPLLMKKFMKPPRPEIEMNTVCFTSKLEEVITNFNQYWPMRDFSFDIRERQANDKKPNAPGSASEKQSSDTSFSNTEGAVSSRSGVNFLGLYGSPDDGSGLTETKCKRKSGSKKSQPRLVTLLRKGVCERQEIDTLIVLPKNFDIPEESSSDSVSKPRKSLRHKPSFPKTQEEPDRSAEEEEPKLGLFQNETRDASETSS